MDHLQMCGEEILRLASSRRRGTQTKPIMIGDALDKLIRAALDGAEPMFRGSHAARSMNAA